MLFAQSLRTTGLVCALFISLSALTVKADLLLEPYVGYQVSGAFESKVSGIPAKSTSSGAAFGARVGWSLPIVWLAGDVRRVSGKLKPEGGGTDDSFEETQLGAVVGADLPMVRAYAGYMLMNELKDTGDGSSFKGSALKFGAGFTGLPFVSLNLEYTMSTYDKVVSAGIEVSPESLGLSDLKSNSLMLSVSLPFEI
jgi:hypothetical protein